MNEGPHLTTDGISAAFEEVLSERDQRAADAHLETCARCQAVLDELILMRRTLHQIGRETPAMPASVQDRLEAALAAESRARQASGGVPSAASALAEPAGEPGTHVVSHAGAESGGGSRGGRGSHGSHRSKHVAPRGRPHSRKGPRNRRSGSGRILAIAATLVVLAVGGLVTYQTMFAAKPDANVATGPSQPASSKAARDPDKYVIAAAPKLTEQRLAKDIGAAVRPGVPRSTPTKGFGPKGIAPDYCAERLVRSKSGLEPLAVSAATYDGQSAFLAITESKSANSVDAYVVVGCPAKAKLARPVLTVPISD